ncbi:hypothetical protein P3T23_008775 [Paraburkholderia sp. GAS448]|uniref:hypothetical protein n=1 Tax=Paraburkholderia sp. GAS448 TaxID=3035136 RepID=UPI003D1DBF17
MNRNLQSQRPPLTDNARQLASLVIEQADRNGFEVECDAIRDAVDQFCKLQGISATEAERISACEEAKRQWRDKQADATLQETLKVRHRLSDGRFVGKVERIEFTQGGAGNQWTTISGIKYATWWDLRTKDWAVGDVVAFKATNAPMWHGQPAVPQASKIERFGDLEALAKGADAGLQQAVMRVTRRQYDAIVASLRLLERQMEKGAVSPNDGDVGDIMTCSGDHQGLSLEELTLFCDAILDSQGVTWSVPVSSN